MNKKQKRMLKRIIAAVALTVCCLFFKSNIFVKTLLSFAAYIVIGHDVLKKALRGILNRRIFDENFLMAVATVGAIALAFFTKSYDFFEAISVMLFYQIGELFQSYAVSKSRKNISSLMDIRPDYANIEKDGVLTRVSPYDVEIGSVIVVSPGEKIPIDGIVLEGASSINTSALTGESLPQSVNAGDEVLSGSVNISGLLKIKTSKAFGESTASQILKLVEDASSRKARSENFISKFARVYTPAVCIGAIALAILPPIVSLVSGSEAYWSLWVYRALTFLVISCPCALVISVPLTFFAGIGGASREGILIKGSSYIETLANAKCVVLDKTGTLTRGAFEVSGIHHNKMDEEKLLEYCALADCASSHPISKSLRQAYGKEIDRSRVTEIEEIGGNGVIATVDGKSVAVGNEKLMQKIGVSYIDCHHAGTISHIAINGEYMGHIVASDIVKPNAKKAIDLLKKSGVRKIVMLTGDGENSSRTVSQELGIDKYLCKLLPADKLKEVENLLQQNKKGSLLFVGDGINDAPVLSRADVGIAMGAIGSDAAIEAADVVLMDDDPLKIVKAIKISQKCIGIVRQNILFAIGIKLLFLLLGALGIANMWLAIFADVGVMVIAVLNAIRALKPR